jgi:hypothetical protein
MAAMTFRDNMGVEFNCYSYESSAGEVLIAYRRERWETIVDGECIGSYDTPLLALGDLVGGHCFSHSTGVDTAELELPDELADWERSLRSFGI